MSYTHCVNVACVILCRDFAPVVPKELRHHMRPSSLHPPIKCIKWNYGAVREIHKRRYVLRVSDVCVCVCTCMRVCVCASACACACAHVWSVNCVQQPCLHLPVHFTMQMQGNTGRLNEFCNKILTALLAVYCLVLLTTQSPPPNVLSAQSPPLFPQLQ